MGVKISQKRALRTAFASSRMEGLRITPQIESDTKRLLNGSLTTEKYVEETKARIAAQKRNA